MTPPEHGAPHSAWARPAPVLLANPLAAAGRFVAKTLVIAELEARKLRHDPTDLILRTAQPLLWLLVFGQVLARMRAIPTGEVRYLDFLAPGILAQSVLFIAIFSGITIIMERDLGIVHKFLVTPTPRAALVLGKALAASLRGVAQAIVVFLVALLIGVRVNPNPLALLGVVVVVVLGACCFATFSLVIACLVKRRERFMGIGQLLTMPLFFASNAIYPITVMPPWLQTVARINPLSYQVDALRALMLADGASVSGIGIDIAVLLGVTAVLVALAGRLYPRVVT